MVSNGSASAACAPQCQNNGGGGFAGQLCQSDKDCAPNGRCRRTPIGIGFCRFR
jgi:hypothetical protein